MGKRIVIGLIILIMLVVLGGLGYYIYRNFFGGSGTLEVWTLPGYERAVERAANVYQDKNPAYRVKIVVVPEQVFEYRSLFALASGEGPDVWLLPNEWIAQHRNKLVAAPEGVLSSAIYSYERQRPKGEETPARPASGRSNEQVLKQDYAPIVANDLIANGSAWGVPITMDTLALYYDKSKISQPPTTWDELLALVKQHTRRSGNSLSQSAIALGENMPSVRHAHDILSILMLQSGTEMVDESTRVATFNISKRGSTPPGTHALDFYTSFAKPGTESYSWNKSLGTSLDALRDGKTYMAFGYLSDLSDAGADSLARIAVAPLPQARRDAPQTYGRYVAATVTKRAEKRDPKIAQQSWRLISYFSNPDIAEESAADLGILPARPDVIKRLSLGSAAKVFADQVGIATNWKKHDTLGAEVAFDEALALVLNKGQAPQVALDVAGKLYTRVLQAPTGIETDENVLTLWQPSDDIADYATTIEDFLAENRDIRRISVSEHDRHRYEWEVLNAMAAYQGPDILLLPNDHVARYVSTLRAFPKGHFNLSQRRLDDADAVRESFVPAVATDNLIDGKLYGMPASIETLMLAFNRDALREVSREKIEAEDEMYDQYEDLFAVGPLIWEDLEIMAEIATKRNGRTIDRPMIALGTGANVAHAEDIYAVLTKQFGGDLTDPDRLVTGIHLPFSSEDTTVPGAQALELIRKFAEPSSPHYTWNQDQPYSLDALADGKVVAAFIYPRDVKYLKDRNAKFEYRSTPLPQLSIHEESIDSASYYTLTIPKAAKRPNESLAFIKKAVLDEVERNGGVSPRKSMTTYAVLDREGTAPQVSQQNTATSYYKGMQPHIVDEALRDLLDRRLSIEQAAARINSVLRKGPAEE